MIFLTGGTGTVGSELLPLLLERGVDLRCLQHSAPLDGSAATAAFEVVEGDVDRPDTYAAELQGCEALFLLTPPHPDQVTREIALIDAARSAGVRRVVAVSVLGADQSSPVAFARWHGEIDEHLMSSGLGCTILRPSAYMQIHLLPPTAAAEGPWYGTTGDGAHPFIDAADVAAVAAEVLAASGGGSAVHELTGPEAISMPRAAAALGEALGRDVAYVDLPPEQFTGALTGAGLPAYVAEGIVSLYAAVRAGYASTTTRTVEDLLGRPAGTYEDLLRRQLTSLPS